MHKKKKLKLWLTGLCLLLILVGGYLLVLRGLMPNVMIQGEAMVSNQALGIMNSAVKEILGQADMSEQLIRVEKDDQNRISMLSMNTMAINEIANRCAIAAKDRIAQFTESSIKVPLGNVVGSKLFSGKGPKIRVKVQQAGTATAGFYTEFETAGINQTRYKIYVVLKARIRMICGAASQVVEVSTEVLISEAIIVGSVPETYANVADLSDFINFVP
jgi:sporulation protein YunB